MGHEETALDVGRPIFGLDALPQGGGLAPVLRAGPILDAVSRTKAAGCVVKSATDKIAP